MPTAEKTAPIFGKEPADRDVLSFMLESQNMPSRLAYSMSTFFDLYLQLKLQSPL